MLKRIRDFIESFIPEKHRTDAELLRKGRIFVWTYSAGIPLVIVLNLIEILNGHLVPALTGLAFLVCLSGMLLLFKHNVSSILLNNIFMCFVYIAYVQGVFIMGGLGAANISFIVLFPLVSMLVSNKKSGLVWLGVSAVIIIGIYWLEITQYANLLSDPKENQNEMVMGYLICSLFFIFSLLWISESSRIKNLQLLVAEKKRSDELLLNILPGEIAEELKRDGHSNARHFDEVTVLFTDFKGFTSYAEKLSAQELVKEINYCFSNFDRICDKYKIEKIKTIGDAYMAAGGLPVANKTHAEDVVNAAIEICDFMRNKTFEIRIGIHTGNVVAGIVGIKKFQYDIWGDTVNTASRMESSGAVGKVNISESTYELVKDKFNCEYRGEIEAKGKGKIKMYFVYNNEI